MALKDKQNHVHLQAGLKRPLLLTGDNHLFMSSHDEVSPLLHRSGGGDLSVRDVRRDEAQQALQEDL